MKAIIKKINYTPRKLRMVANLVKGMNIDDALQYLKNVNRKGSLIVYKALKSALSNALNQGYNPSGLFVKNILVNESLKLKRLNPVSRGRAFLKLKRYSTIIVNLEKNG